MSLDIGIGDGSSPQPLPGEPLIQLDNDGPYWFLYPLFERLWTETEQMIDLYGYASFAGDGLTALKRMLAAARTMVKKHPAAWQVHVGTQTAPIRRELYRPVERAALLELLEAWVRIVERAEELGKPVVCFGD